MGVDVGVEVRGGCDREARISVGTPVRKGRMLIACALRGAHRHTASAIRDKTSEAAAGDDITIPGPDSDRTVTMTVVRPLQQTVSLRPIRLDYKVC